VWVRMLAGKPLGTIGGVIVVAMLAAAVLADWIAPYGYAQTSLRQRFIAMSAAHEASFATRRMSGIPQPRSPFEVRQITRHLATPSTGAF